MKEKIRLLFIGTPLFVCPILESLVKSQQTFPWKVVGVLTQPDKKVGRKQLLMPSPVKALAIQFKLPWLTPEKISSPDFFDDLKLINPDLIILAAYAQKIPMNIINYPRYRSLGLHPSLLPKYRGVSPVQAAILAGETETGISIFQMDEGFDSGPVIFQQPIKVRDQDTGTVLTEKLFTETAEILPPVLSEYISGKLVPTAQNHVMASYTKMLNRDSGKINWHENDLIIERMIRAYHPWPGTWTIWKNKRLLILKAHLENYKLVLDEVQPEGKKPMTLEEFQRGQKDFSLDSLRGFKE